MKAILRKTILLVFMVLAGCTAAATPTPALEAVTLKLSWQDGVQFLGLYIAQERCYYADEGLNITTEPIADSSEGNTMPQRVAEGEFDFGLSGSPLILAQAQGISVTAISPILQLNPPAFFARADSGIITPADLVGRRVVVKSEGWRLMLEALLDHAGLTLADVETIDGSFDMTPFYEGEVEVWSGFLTNEVIRARQQGLELVTFPLFEYGIKSTPTTLFTSQELLESNPQLAVRFLRASLRGWEWAVENPVEAVDIMLERFPDLADDRDFHIASFDAYIPLIKPLDTAIGTLDCEHWLSDERFADLDSTAGLCTTDIFEQATRAD